MLEIEALLISPSSKQPYL